MWNAELAPWPAISQLSALTDDGQADENWDSDCGEAVVAQINAYLTGNIWRPDSIKDAMLGQGVIGYSNEYQLTAFMNDRLGIPATIFRPADRGTAMRILRAYIQNGKPLLVLRYGTAIGANDGHWNAIIGGSGSDDNHTDTVITFDPWGAFRRVEAVATFWSWAKPYPSARLFIGVDRQQAIVTDPPFTL